MTWFLVRWLLIGVLLCLLAIILGELGPGPFDSEGLRWAFLVSISGPALEAMARAAFLERRPMY